MRLQQKILTGFSQYIRLHSLYVYTYNNNHKYSDVTSICNSNSTCFLSHIISLYLLTKYLTYNYELYTKINLPDFKP